MEIQHSAVIEYIVRRRFPKPVSQSHENDLMIFMNRSDRAWARHRHAKPFADHC